MKRFLLFNALSILLFSAAFAQYTPIAIDGQVFFKVEIETENEVTPAEITIADFDIFDDEYYSRVFLKEGLGGDMLIGHIREDASVGTLFFRPLNGEDQLAFDVSLTVGDSITLNARWCDDETSDVAHVLADEMINGRKVLTFDREVGYDEICETLQFIEGIGPTASVLLPYLADNMPVDGAAMRICHAVREGQVFYPNNASVDLCGNVPVETEELFLDQIRIYPNPFAERLFVQNAPNDFAIRIFSATGQLMQESQNLTTIELAYLKAGVYFAEITVKGKRLTWKKLICRE